MEDQRRQNDAERPDDEAVSPVPAILLSTPVCSACINLLDARCLAYMLPQVFDRAIASQ